MVKLAPARIEAFLRKPDSHIRAILVYGPDEGLVRERAAALGKTVIQDLNDPFRVAELSPSLLASHPGRLMEEMAALSLMGGRRLVRVRETSESITPAFAAMFETPPPGDTLVVVEGDDLDKRSKLRTLFENAEHAVAIPCYVEDQAGLERSLTALLAAEGLSANTEVRAYLASRLVGDRAMARSEITKLAIYMGNRKQVELQDVEACISDASAHAWDEPVWDAADGKATHITRVLEKLYEEGVSPVAILRVAQKHFERLHRVASATAAGQSLPDAVAALKPPVFFKQQPRFTQQARRWSLPALNSILGKLLETEVLCKKTGYPDTTLCSHILYQIATQAGKSI